MSKLKHIKNAAYRLKQLRGFPIAYSFISTHSVDPKTGNKTTVNTTIQILKAVVLRAREFRSFVYDLAYISANKDFTTGGYFDPEDRRVIIQSSDLQGHNPQIGDHFVFQGSRYDVKEVLEFENNFAFGLLARKVKGQEVEHPVARHHGIIFNQTADAIIDNSLIRNVESVLTFSQDLQENP
jgi:hypothetical protein